MRDVGFQDFHISLEHYMDKNKVQDEASRIFSIRVDRVRNQMGIGISFILQAFVAGASTGSNT